MGPKLTLNDKKELMFVYPELHCSLNKQIIWGTLSFSCCYDSSTKELIYNNLSPNLIRGSYEIEINLNKHDTFGFPKVYETSNIVLDYAKQNQIKLEDLHINKEDNNSCCLGIFPEYKWTTAMQFIIDKIIPFFYWQSYRRIYGLEPWKGYSHETAGFNEKIYDLTKDINDLKDKMQFTSNNAAKNRSRNKLCPCGSKRKYKNCCFSRDLIIKSEVQVLEDAKRIVQYKRKIRKSSKK